MKDNNGPTEYRTTILLPKPSQNLVPVSLLEPGIPDYKASLGILRTYTLPVGCREQREG
jgi:hypothetical protein